MTAKSDLQTLPVDQTHHLKCKSIILKEKVEQSKDFVFVVSFKISHVIIRSIAKTKQASRNSREKVAKKEWQVLFRLRCDW